MDAYTKELQTCGSENLTVNVRTLDNSAAVQQMQLAFSGGGTSPYDIVHMANSSIATIGGQGWLMPLNELVDNYRVAMQLQDLGKASAISMLTVVGIFVVLIPFLRYMYRNQLAKA